MDVQECSKLIHEELTESRNETFEQLKAVAQAICVFVAWMIVFSHMDEIGYILWATYSCAVLPIMKVTIAIDIYLVKILMNLSLRMIVGWIVSMYVLSIALIPQFLFDFTVCVIRDGASAWQSVFNYPPNTTYLRPVGTRVGFHGERIAFGGKSSLPRVKQVSRLDSFLGFNALRILSMLNDLARLHNTCFQLGWPFLCLGAIGLHYLLVGLRTQVKSLIQRSMSILPNRHFFKKILSFGYDSKLEGDRESGYDSKLEGDHGKATPQKCSVHLTLDGTSFFNQWITAFSVDDVRKQIHERFARALKRKELKFAPTHFLLSGKTRGRIRFLTSREEIYDGMRIIISPVGRGGMQRKDGFKLAETPSPDRVPPPKFSQIPRPGTSLAQRTTAASDEESQRRSVRFTNVGELETRLKDAEDRAESESKRASVIERQLDDMTESFKRLTEEREREEREKAEHDKTPTKPRTLEFTMSPKEKGSADEATAKVFLGNNPPNLDVLADVSDKKVTERVETVSDWLESLRSWTQDTVSHGDVVFEALKDAADEYYQRWLTLTADPFRLSELRFESIADGSDSLEIKYYEEFLLRSYGKISKALPKRLSTELKAEVAVNKLTSFQKVAAILVTVLTNLGVTNLTEHTALFGTLHHPSQWLHGTHVKDGPTGSISLSSYVRTLEFAQTLPRVSQLDIGRLTTGVTTLVNEIMPLLDKLQSDEMSKRARENGLFEYGCKLTSLVSIIKMCRDVTHVSAPFKKNFKERSEKKEKDKKEREETNKRKRGNLASRHTDQPPPETPATNDQPTSSTANQAKAKGKGQKGKGAKGIGKNGEPKEQGTPAKGATQGGDKNDVEKSSPKKCSVCGKTLAEHPDKKWCIPLCYECGKPLDAHANRRWCPRKNGQSPPAAAGSSP